MATGETLNPFSELIARSHDLERAASALQDDAEPSVEERRAFEQHYLEWFAVCMATLPEDLRKGFADQYEGGTFTPRIKGIPRKSANAKCTLE